MAWDVLRLGRNFPKPWQRLESGSYLGCLCICGATDYRFQQKARYESDPALFEGLKKYHHKKPDAMLRQWIGVWLDPAFKTWNIEHFLPAINVPQLVIQGKDDEYGSLAQVDAMMQKSGGNVLPVILENCGHWPYRSQTEKTLDSITGFLETL